jgi:hypothetical protein
MADDVDRANEESANWLADNLRRVPPPLIIGMHCKNCHETLEKNATSNFCDADCLQDHEQRSRYRARG